MLSSAVAVISFRLGKSRTQCAQDDKTRNAQTARCGKLIREEKSAPERDARVDQAETHRGAHQTEVRHQQNRNSSEAPSAPR